MQDPGAGASELYGREHNDAETLHQSTETQGPSARSSLAVHEPRPVSKPLRRVHRQLAASDTSPQNQHTRYCSPIRAL